MLTNSNWFRHIKDVVCDATCVVCRRTIEAHESTVCEHCSNTFVSAPLPSELAQRIPQTEGTREVRAYALYGLYAQAPFFEVLHAIKYHRTLELAFNMGTRLGDYVRIVAPKIDSIVPIPLHPARRRERGYNQSEVIANGVASRIGCEVQTTVLKRIRNNRTQTDLQHNMRQHNVAGVFALAHEGIDLGEHVLVIDDVMTTGATIMEAIRVLRKEMPQTTYSIGVLATTGKQ